MILYTCALYPIFLATHHDGNCFDDDFCLQIDWGAIDFDDDAPAESNGVIDFGTVSGGFLTCCFVELR